MLIHALVAMNDASASNRVIRLLGQRGLVLRQAPEASGLLETLSGADFDLLVVDRGLLQQDPNPLIHSVRSLPERPEVIVLTDHENVDDRGLLLASGCLAVLSLRLGDPALRKALTTLVERRREEASNRLRADRPEEKYSLNDFVSESPVMQMFLDLARRVVRADTSLLILGETGVGKERLARGIHEEGPRSRGPFMAINCGALPESLLESELFGHEEGAFTGATRSRKGYFELAHRGTIFLDEVAEMPLHLQVKLLRVLDEHRFQRVGAENTISVNVRVMAATNRNLEAEVAANRFRADLYYRLAVVSLEVPPLRERREDISGLVESYFDHFRTQTGRMVKAFDERAMQAMVSYDWPGNVRELANTVERAVLLATGEGLTLVDLPARVSGVVSGPPSSSPEGRPWDPLPQGLLDRSLAEARRTVVAEFESRYLAALLQSNGGRIGDTAKQAGINQRSLYDLMKKRGLTKEAFKARS